MSIQFRNIVAPCVAFLAFAGCDSIQRRILPPDFHIEQIKPDTIRADKPTELTITGTGFKEVDEVRFGFKKRSGEIDTIEEFEIVDANTITLLSPVLPSLEERAKVFVSVGRSRETEDASNMLEQFEIAPDRSIPVAVTFRPPNIIDLYGMYALMVTGAFVALLIVFALIRRSLRRIAYRGEVLEAKGKRLALRDERRARHVLAEIAAEKEAAQAKLEAEYLPYADQASGSDSDK